MSVMPLEAIPSSYISVSHKP